jgi:hypothetical protein
MSLLRDLEGGAYRQPFPKRLDSTPRQMPHPATLGGCQATFSVARHSLEEIPASGSNWFTSRHCCHLRLIYLQFFLYAQSTGRQGALNGAESNLGDQCQHCH